MKRVFIVIAIIIVASVIVLVGLRIYTKSFSPEAEASFKQGDFTIQVDYCQPTKKERLIFGKAQDEALIPYGKVWRTGANEATLIELSQPITFMDGQTLAAGRYSLFTIPQSDQWTIIFNKETGQWGTNYDEVQNHLLVLARSETLEEEIEAFTISFIEKANQIDLVLRWDRTKVILPFKIES
ncbi:MAG: DUF2911 domain-containing protein [Bacteroidota bacterium]